VARLRIPDEESVWLGKYNATHFEVTAAEANGIARDRKDPAGLEVILPRAVQASEILNIIALPKAVVWRYAPNAKGKKPCGCSYCQRAEPGGRKVQDRYEQGD
jgi:hypothetical protein